MDGSILDDLLRKERGRRWTNERSGGAGRAPALLHQHQLGQQHVESWRVRNLLRLDASVAQKIHELFDLGATGHVRGWVGLAAEVTIGHAIAQAYEGRVGGDGPKCMLHQLGFRSLAGEDEGGSEGIDLCDYLLVIQHAVTKRREIPFETNELCDWHWQKIRLDSR